MAPTFVQSKAFNDASGTSHAVTLDAAPTTGNLLVLGVRAPTDTGGITAPANWSTALSLDDSGQVQDLAIFYRVAGAGESATVTYGTDTSVASVAHVAEFSGSWDQVTALDKTNSVDSTSTVTSQATGSTGTLAQADEVMFAMVTTQGTDGGGVSVDSGFTTLTGTTLGRFAYKIVTATTGENPTFSWTTARQALTGIATFKQSAATANLTPAVVTAAAVAVAPTPGMVTVSLTSAAVTAAGVAVSPQPGMVTVTLVSASFTATAVAFAASGSVALLPADLVAAAVAVTPVPGPVTVALAPAVLTAAAVAVTVTAVDPYPKHLALDHKGSHVQLDAHHSHVTFLPQNPVIAP